MSVLEESGMKRLQAAMTALAATLLLSIGLTYSASAASIGYGILLGTWGLGGGNLTNSYSADDLEAAIAADNPSTEPFASLGTGLNQFESAGKIDFPSTTTGRITFGSIRESYVFVIECLERQEVGSWTARVSRCGFRRRAG